MRKIVKPARDRFHDGVCYAIAGCMLLMAVLLFVKYRSENHITNLLLPKTVMTAIQKDFPGATLLTAEPVRHYAIMLRVGQQNKDIDISSQGIIYQIKGDTVHAACK